MKASEAAEVRKTAMAQASDTTDTKEANKEKKADEKKEEGKEFGEGAHEVATSDVLPDSSAQVSSVAAGAMGQSWGLPKPVTQKDLDDQKAAEAKQKEENKKEKK